MNNDTASYHAKRERELDWATGRELERKDAEIERLRGLVRSAYAEGFSEGMNEHTKFNGGKPWQDSRTRHALEQKVREG